MLRTCKVCHKEKPLEEFKKDKTCSGGYSPKCLECVRVQGREYYRKTKDRPDIKNKRRLSIKKHDLKRKYGLTLLQVEGLIMSQGGLCGICYRELSGIKYHIDHDHEIGVVRGVLCSNCNTAIGMFKENLVSLFGAIRYLSKWQAGREQNENKPASKSGPRAAIS